VVGAAHEVREMLVNLIFNAVDAMPEGGTLTIRTWADPDRSRVHCAVADTGTGMTAEVLARCFDPFFTTKAERGTGLGLALVQSLTHRLHGAVGAASEPGAGTTVTVTLPASPERDRGEDRPAGVPAAGVYRILLVDDDPQVLSVVRALLAHDGHTIHAFQDGRHALDWLSTAGEPVDVVISDLGLEGMSGWDVVREARAHRAGVRAGLLTGYGAEIDPAEARSRGVEFVIAKPARRADLRRALGNLPAAGRGSE